jgi:hypothetical protein
MHWLQLSSWWLNTDNQQGHQQETRPINFWSLSYHSDIYKCYCPCTMYCGLWDAEHPKDKAIPAQRLTQCYNLGESAIRIPGPKGAHDYFKPKVLTPNWDRTGSDFIRGQPLTDKNPLYSWTKKEPDCWVRDPALAIQVEEEPIWSLLLLVDLQQGYGKTV